MLFAAANFPPHVVKAWSWGPPKKLLERLPGFRLVPLGAAKVLVDGSQQTKRLKISAWFLFNSV